MTASATAYDATHQGVRRVEGCDEAADRMADNDRSRDPDRGQDAMHDFDRGRARVGVAHAICTPHALPGDDLAAPHNLGHRASPSPIVIVIADMLTQR